MFTFRNGFGCHEQTTSVAVWGGCPGVGPGFTVCVVGVVVVCGGVWGTVVGVCGASTAALVASDEESSSTSVVLVEVTLSLWFVVVLWFV